MPDNITPLDIAKRLAEGVKCGACGGHGQVNFWDSTSRGTCPTCNGEGVERCKVHPPSLVYANGPRGWQIVWFPTAEDDNRTDRFIAAPCCDDAILWLLGTAAWRAKYGKNDGALVQRPGFVYLLGAPFDLPPSTTPIPILTAMLEALT